MFCSGADLTRLDQFASELLRAGTAPALAVALTDRERTLAVRTYGAASPESLWPIGSIGKSFTAVVTLQLVDDGVLALDAPITDYLPWFRPGSEPGSITLHHLLTHTSGLIAMSDLAPASGYDVIALADTELGFPPGEHRYYSDVGYRAIGVVLERVTGRSYPQLVQERVLDRLGMRDSAPAIIHDTRRRLQGGNVPFYDDRPWRPEHGLVPAPWIESAEADGCQCCTVLDLARYLRALWNGNGELLAPASAALMRTALPPLHTEGDVDGYDYGYGLVIEPDGFGHSGDMVGYVAHMWADDASGYGVVAFANGPAGAFKLGEMALALITGAEPPDPAPTLAEPLIDDGSCSSEWRAFVGRYRCHNPWQPTFLIAARAGELVLGVDWMESQRLALTPVDKCVFRVGEPEWSPERLRFDAFVDGRAHRATLSGTPYYRAFAL